MRLSWLAPLLALLVGSAAARWYRSFRARRARSLLTPGLVSSACGAAATVNILEIHRCGDGKAYRRAKEGWRRREACTREKQERRRFKDQRSELGAPRGRMARASTRFASSS